MFCAKLKQTYLALKRNNISKIKCFYLAVTLDVFLFGGSLPKIDFYAIQQNHRKNKLTLKIRKFNNFPYYTENKY